MEDITHSVGKPNSSVSHQYLAQYFQVFDLLDKTRDDTEVLDRMVVKQRVGLVWQDLDKDNDGLISQDSHILSTPPQSERIVRKQDFEQKVQN